MNRFYMTTEGLKISGTIKETWIDIFLGHSEDQDCNV